MRFLRLVIANNRVHIGSAHAKMPNPRCEARLRPIDRDELVLISCMASENDKVRHVPRVHHPSKPKPGLPGAPASSARNHTHLPHGGAVAGAPRLHRFCASWGGSATPVVAPPALGFLSTPRPGVESLSKRQSDSEGVEWARARARSRSLSALAARERLGN